MEDEARMGEKIVLKFVETDPIYAWPARMPLMIMELIMHVEDGLDHRLERGGDALKLISQCDGIGGENFTFEFFVASGNHFHEILAQSLRVVGAAAAYDIAHQNVIFCHTWIFPGKRSKCFIKNDTLR